MRGFLQSQCSWMGVGTNGCTSSQGLGLSMDKKLASCGTLGSAISTVLHVLGASQKSDVCYKNWNASSSQMETSIILEGFKNAERVHGVCYIRFIADGDSSVYPSLLQNVPVWEHATQKLEYANHTCKYLQIHTVQYWRSWHQRIQITKAEVDSLRKCAIGSLVLPEVQSRCVARRVTLPKHWSLWRKT